MIPLGVLASGYVPPAGSSWTPADLTGLVAWWDASDTATITHDDTGAVSAWADKSGNGYSLTQPTSTRRPTTGATSLNSLNVLTFDGGDDIISATLAQSQPFTIATVWRDVPGDARWYSSASNDVQYISWLGIYAGTAVLNGPAYTPNTWAYSTHIFNGSSSVVRLNGTAGSTGNPGATAMSGSLWIGSRTGSFYLTGNVAEFIVAAGALTGSDLTDLETYLSDKWGL